MGKRYCIVWNDEETPRAEVIDIEDEGDATRVVINLLRRAWNWTAEELSERTDNVHVFDVTEETQTDPRVILPGGNTMETKYFCIYRDDPYMPLITIISTPMPVTAQRLKHKVALWAWAQVYSSSPESDDELFDPEGEHLATVGALDEGGLDEIRWFEVDKAFGKKKLHGRFNIHGESDEGREAYNQANFETCKELAIG